VRDHIDELDDAALAPELMRLVAHVSALRVVLRRWADGELGAASSISYPDALLRHAEAAFRRCVCFFVRVRVCHGVHARAACLVHLAVWCGRGEKATHLWHYPARFFLIATVLNDTPPLPQPTYTHTTQAQGAPGAAPRRAAAQGAAGGRPRRGPACVCAVWGWRRPY
jgi:hypothetical protein